jgi:hypothetical protein
MVENIGFEIPQITNRNQCWKIIASIALNDFAWKKSLEFHNFLNSQEAQHFYLIGWANAIKIPEIDNILTQQVLPILTDQPKSVETMLQKFALRELSEGNPSKELIARLNRTLNIQWAIDIKNQLPN